MIIQWYLFCTHSSVLFQSNRYHIKIITADANK